MNKTILVTGGWHLGAVYASCLADLGHKVYIWDQRLSVKKSWEKAKAPVYEPGLQDIIDRLWLKNLFLLTIK